MADDWKSLRTGPVESGGGVSGEKPFPQKLPREGLELSFSVIADTIQEVKKSSLLELMIFS
ncbi:MAG: hypothetical protein AB7V04_08020 [Desulfomonilaceae bacterium]